MEVTGIFVRVDDLGRVHIPTEIRRKLHIREGQLLEIYIAGEDKGVVFEKCSPEDETQKEFE